MAAITKRLLYPRPNFQYYGRPHPFPHLHFSSSSDPDIPQPEPVGKQDSATQPESSFSSYFNEVKASLEKEPPPQNRQQAPSKAFSFSSRAPPQTTPQSRADSTEEIRRSLSEFRIRSAAPPPPSSTGQFISFQELYERNVNSKTEDSANSSGVAGKQSFDAIRGSLRQIDATSQTAMNRNESGRKPSGTSSSLARLTENLKLKADPNASMDSTMLGQSLFSNAKKGKRDGNFGRMVFEKTYDHVDLGKKLKKLRPEKRKGKWFSLRELSDRLAKLKETEDKETDARLGSGVVKEVRDGLSKIGESQKRKTIPVQSLGILASLGGTPSYMLSLPKDHLVEKYFHPDNMSSAEKLKLELKKVRDEFKMTESDCGSARVQVAQLTTKIKHLSTCLQKKDKHSRKGLQAMVQRRKKLLKYLRRTDWDSYCLVLSKLGLRDNPDIKA